jgi:tetratricopeptide (TPR) repeat protein
MRGSKGSKSAIRLAGGLFVAWYASGCAQLPIAGGGAPLRLSEIASDGDPQRRASMSLCLTGLAADESNEHARAEGLYERALQLDSTNPFAYLALARHRVEQRDARAALDALGRAQSLLPADDAWVMQRVEPHMLGLRGASLRLLGRTREADPLLARARSLAPAEWDDGRLAAVELR